MAAGRSHRERRLEDDEARFLKPGTNVGGRRLDHRQVGLLVRGEQDGNDHDGDIRVVDGTRRIVSGFQSAASHRGADRLFQTLFALDRRLAAVDRRSNGRVEVTADDGMTS